MRPNLIKGGNKMNQPTDNTMKKLLALLLETSAPRIVKKMEGT